MCMLCWVAGRELQGARAPGVPGAEAVCRGVQLQPVQQLPAAEREGRGDAVQGLWMPRVPLAARVDEAARRVQGRVHLLSRGQGARRGAPQGEGGEEGGGGEAQGDGW